MSSVKKIVFCGWILLSFLSNVICQDNEKINRDNARHYLTHILTYYVGRVAAGIVTGYGIGLTGAGAVTIINEDKCHNTSCYTKISLPAIIGILLSTYIYYKTPQWTDMYILNSDQKRTAAQNILVMLSRIVVPFPLLNVIIGEYCAGTDVMSS